MVYPIPSLDLQPYRRQGLNDATCIDVVRIAYAFEARRQGSLQIRLDGRRTAFGKMFLKRLRTDIEPTETACRINAETSDLG